MRLLVVEDDDSALTVCRDSVDTYKEQKQLDIELEECKSLDDALSRLDNSFDGAIIDLKLGNQDDGGNQIIKEIRNSCFRVPVVVVTGYPPEDEYLDVGVVSIVTKGTFDSEYHRILDTLHSIYRTGLTRIMGGRGVIEEHLSRVFLRNLLPQKDKWIQYGREDPEETERALLRHTLNHLLQLLDDNEAPCYPEEVYLIPPLIKEIQTGSLVKEKNGDTWYAVMSPACDLVIRSDGDRNTDRILVVRVEAAEKVFPWYQNSQLTNANKKDLKSARKNNKWSYYHWLPENKFFKEGFLNFRKLTTLEDQEFERKFQIPPEIQISPSFVKDIVARFSSYYARQGQPEIDLDKLPYP